MATPPAIISGVPDRDRSESDEKPSPFEGIGDSRAHWLAQPDLRAWSHDGHDGPSMASCRLAAEQLTRPPGFRGGDSAGFRAQGRMLIPQVPGGSTGVFDVVVRAAGIGRTLESAPCDCSKQSSE